MMGGATSAIRWLPRRGLGAWLIRDDSIHFYLHGCVMYSSPLRPVDQRSQQRCFVQLTYRRALEALSQRLGTTCDYLDILERRAVDDVLRRTDRSLTALMPFHRFFSRETVPSLMTAAARAEPPSPGSIICFTPGSFLAAFTRSRTISVPACVRAPSANNYLLFRQEKDDCADCKWKEYSPRISQHYEHRE